MRHHGRTSSTPAGNGGSKLGGEYPSAVMAGKSGCLHALSLYVFGVWWSLAQCLALFGSISKEELGWPEQPAVPEWYGTKSLEDRLGEDVVLTLPAVAGRWLFWAVSRKNKAAVTLAQCNLDFCYSLWGSLYLASKANDACCIAQKQLIASKAPSFCP